ncbi:MAG: CDP-diacylglycerol/glycerol-3-phosphate 3-phosphatidyltransferase [Holophagaceae bacterium]|nr:CDP-diacylglycerol/glycerol-3-phosphate 3-phosphatidyltransferase [Holophagaceae bacterium]
MPLTLTVPNCLTFLRILAVPFFAIAVWYGRMPEACLIFALAGLTDLLDGFIARRFNQKSDLGAVLDPAADKLLMTTAFILLAFPRSHYVVQIPAWVSILAISRDVVISLVALNSYAHFDPAKFQPSILGKLTTGVQLVAISVALLLNALPHQAWIHAFVPWFFYLVAVMVLASGFQYFFRATHTRPEAP